MSFGRKNEGGDEIMAEINMTPLIDIMLVLLIIFMVTSSISLDSGLDIDLPKTTTKAAASKEGSAVIISLDKDGQISVQGKKVAFDNLPVAIKDALREEKTGLVVFEGDTQSTLGRTVEIMDVAKLAGAEKFAIATDGQTSPGTSLHK